ncbi:MAG TPA: hypothetical protein PKA53_02120 [Sphingobacterium sp.]|nr:hypothetical protein [Sphingobacterium sp.]
MKERKYKFNRIYFSNRWKQRKYRRSDNWVIFGVTVHWAGIDDYCYRIGFFGLELKVWFKRNDLEG